MVTREVSYIFPGNIGSFTLFANVIIVKSTRAAASLAWPKVIWGTRLVISVTILSADVGGASGWAAFGPGPSTSHRVARFTERLNWCECQRPSQAAALSACCCSSWVVALTSTASANCSLN